MLETGRAPTGVVARLALDCMQAVKGALETGTRLPAGDFPEEFHQKLIRLVADLIAVPKDDPAQGFDEHDAQRERGA